MQFKKMLCHSTQDGMGQKVINLYLNGFKLYVHIHSAPKTTKVEELGSVSVCGLFMGSRVSK
jgi:hypothetical protein